MSVGKFKDVTINDIIANPNKYGAPTFEQFCSDPAAWRLPSDQLLISADQGSKRMKNVVKHHYDVNGVKCRSLEEVERVCLNEGLRQQDLEMKADARNVGGDKVEMYVSFRSKLNVPKVP